MWCNCINTNFVLTFQGYMDQFYGFFLTQNGRIALIALILIIGEFICFVGAWTKRSHEMALTEQKKAEYK